MEPDYSLSIIQISDLHWNRNRIANRDTLDQIPLADIHGDVKRSLHEAALECGRTSTETLLILGGDNVLKGNYDEEQGRYKREVADLLLSEVLGPTIRLLKDSGEALFGNVIAVPGNHDIDPFSTANTSSDRFTGFNDLISRLRALSPSSVKYHVPDGPGQLFRISSPRGPICLWAVNSAAECGGKDSAEMQLATVSGQLRKLLDNSEENSIPPGLYAKVKEIAGSIEIGKAEHYPGYVSPKNMRECEHGLHGQRDALRIAVLHHNNLLTAADDTQKYRFINPSKFNSFLLDHQFRIVLHGHQHVGEVAVYNKFPSEHADYSSYLTNGFLTIGSPAYDLGAWKKENGFNVIRLVLSARHQICRVDVTKHLWDLSKFTVTRRSYDLALAPFDSSRSAIQRDVNRLIFSDRSIRGIVRVIDSEDYPQHYADSLRNVLRNLQDVRAIYALSVFHPTNWLHSKLMEVFYGFGQKSLVEAASRFTEATMMPGLTGFQFRFSRPLAFGIDTAKRNSLDLSDALIQNARRRFSELQYSQAFDFVDKQLSLQKDTLRGLSMFARSLRATGAERNMSKASLPAVLIASGPRRAFHNYSGKYDENARQNMMLREFPRIALWSVDDLRRPSVLDIIEFHEAMGFPLFWLDRSLLVSSDGTQLRKEIGYLSIIAPVPGDDEEKTAIEVVHNGDGGILPQFDVNDVWHGGPRSWFLDKKNMELGDEEFNRINKKALHEYIWLLGHPSLCFAADAWLASHAGDQSWREYRNRLKSALSVSVEGGIVLPPSGGLQSIDPFLGSDDRDEEERFRDRFYGEGAYD